MLLPIIDGLPEGVADDLATAIAEHFRIDRQALKVHNRRLDLDDRYTRPPMVTAMQYERIKYYAQGYLRGRDDFIYKQM